MPTSDPYTPGEVARALDRLEKSISSLTSTVVTKSELQLHMDGLRQQFKVIDDRHNNVVSDLAEERRIRVDAEKDRKREAEERAKELRTFKAGVVIAVIAACAAVILPLLLRGVGLS